jgi:hypothetical protein
MGRKLRLICLLVGSLAACSDDDDDDAPTADAAPQLDTAAPIDAAPTPPDPTSSYSPEPLAVGEISAADQLVIARRFNPAHVYTNPDHFASPLDYVLEQGAGLMQAKVLQTGPFWMALDVASAVEITGIDLMTEDWSDQPLMDGQGNPLAYYIDTPGDNTGAGFLEESWTQGWSDAGGPAYTPTQYAHLFWLSKADGYLAIQYWSFYPWNKFPNSHEGDWEHLNVIVKNEGGDWHIVMSHYSFHARQVGLLAEDMVRIGDLPGGPGDGDHPVVFVGGSACGMFGAGQPMFCGTASGASFPYPGVYTLAVVETAAGGPSIAGRPYHANDIDVIVLPRDDEPVPAKLSWYKLPFFAGQPEALANASAVLATNAHRAPVAPNHHHFEFEEAIPMPYDLVTNAVLEPFTPPVNWTVITNPTTGF